MLEPASVHRQCLVLPAEKHVGSHSWSPVKVMSPFSVLKHSWAGRHLSHRRRARDVHMQPGHITSQQWLQARTPLGRGRGHLGDRGRAVRGGWGIIRCERSRRVMEMGWHTGQMQRKQPRSSSDIIVQGSCAIWFSASVVTVHAGVPGD